jgi:adenylate kinase|tara:strand:+ start:444 stop:1094 length:651 start_codon:yes stop_codon:yes gene_type:complete
MNIVIFGPPGAGKGTQSKFIVKKYNLFQLSTGELLRNEIINKTDLGFKVSSIMNRGNLVSDNIVSDLIEKFISDRKYSNRLIFDGYPRNKIQAENLNVLLNKNNQKIDLVLKLSVSLDVIKKRIIGRSVCSICGKIYNEFFNPAPIKSDCCASKYLQKRSDDTLDIAISRFETYEISIKPVIDFYKESKLLKVVNGETPISEITDEISGLIDALKG